MINIEKKENCCGCSACAQACPQKCISMKTDDEGFVYPEIDSSECINCGLCEKVCHFTNRTAEKKTVLSLYAAKCTDDGLRSKSASGGMFSLLAENVLDNGGVVFGAAFSDDFKEVFHTYIDDKSELYKLRTSKYVQSNMRDSYMQAKKFLDDGTLVLFSGTPCQTDGLKGYLKKDYANLLCIEVICFGIPSPKVWNKYLDEQGERFDSINFRSKQNGWHNYGILKKSENSTTFTSHKNDPYLKLFTKGYILRPSCYNCASKVKDSKADISLGDFWRIQSVAPELDNDDGVSMIVIRTEKGQNIFDLIKPLIEYESVDSTELTLHKGALRKSAALPSDRNCAFSYLKNHSVKKTADKFCRLSFKDKIKSSKIYKMLKK